MLKKLVLASAILAMSATSAFAAGTGAYVGASLDGNYSLFKDEAQNSIGSTGNFGKLSPGVSLFAGYGKIVRERIYLGGEIFGSATNSEVKGLSNNTNSLKYDTYSSFGVSFIPGVMLSNSTLAYARLGVVKTKFEVKDTGNNIDSSNDETVSGGQAGVGLQTHLTSKLDLRGEYDYTKYNSFDTGSNDQNKISPTSGQVKLGLVYNIG